jgi:hypothetical protein
VCGNQSRWFIHAANLQRWLIVVTYPGYSLIAESSLLLRLSLYDCSHNCQPITTLLAHAVTRRTDAPNARQ